MKRTQISPRAIPVLTMMGGGEEGTFFLATPLPHFGAPQGGNL